MVLKLGIVPEFHAAVSPGFQFEDDYVCPHRFIVIHPMKTNRFPHLPLPAVLPDLNPIEHAWNQLQILLDYHNFQPQTLEQLRNFLPQLWQQRLQEDLNDLITTMQRRCQAVIKTYVTRYC